MLLSGISVLSGSYPCTDVTILRNNPTDALTYVNPLNPELYPICYLLALLAHHFL